MYLHSFIHPSRVYYELTIWPAPSWLDSSVGRALHRHRRGHGFESRSNLNFFRLSFRNCFSCVVTPRIFLLFDLSSAIQIYVSYIYVHLFILHGYITNSQYDQLPVGLIAQLVEHCIGIAQDMGSNPVQAWIFFRLSFRNCFSCVVTARIFLLFDLSSAVQIYVSYIYIHLFILHVFITNSQYDQLPVGLIAQLVEHCSGIADVVGLNPVQA